MKFSAGSMALRSARLLAVPLRLLAVSAVFAASDLTVARIQRLLARDKFAVIRAADMKALLAALGGGEEDISALSTFWELAEPQRDEQGKEVYPYKGTLTTYYALQSFADAFNMSRVTHPNWPAGRTIEKIDPTTVHEVSFHRVHRAWPAEADKNSIFQAIHRLVHEVIVSPSPLEWQGEMEDGGGGQQHVEVMSTAFRVKKSDDPSSLLYHGTPGPEGVHQDACDLTLIVLLRRHNLAPASSSNRVWHLSQPSGRPSAADIANASGTLLVAPMLLEPLDTLLVLDREVKHEARPFDVASGALGGVAERDVLTLEASRRQRLHVATGASDDGAVLVGIPSYLKPGL